uniref:Uncharacterized protein n=1 Tax=Solanum tuberosum TaxID=4113 RepID=M0ZXW8_SOLTU
MIGRTAQCKKLEHKLNYQNDHSPGRYALALSHTPYPIPQIQSLQLYGVFSKDCTTFNLLSISSFEESASSNQNHPAEICGSEAHTDDTLGIDDDSNRHDIEGAKVSSLAENEKHCRMDSEATFEEKIKQLQKDKVSHMQKEAIFEEKLKQFSREKDASLLKEEASFEMKIMQLQDEISSLRRQEANQEEKIRQLHMEKDVYLQKEAGLEKRNNELVDEVEKLNSKRVMNPEV